MTDDTPTDCAKRRFFESVGAVGDTRWIESFDPGARLIRAHVRFTAVEQPPSMAVHTITGQLLGRVHYWPGRLAPPTLHASR